MTNSGKKVQRRYTEKTGYPAFRFDAKAPRNIGVWNLMRDGVTPTFIDSFLSCRELTRLAYVEGWQGRSNPIGLEFGNCIHWVFEQAYTRESGVGIVTCPSREWCIDRVVQYDLFWGKDNPSPSEKQIEQQNLVYGYAAATLPSYFQRWDGDFTGTYSQMPNGTAHPAKWLATEGEIDVPYVYDDGLVVRLRGKRDFVYADPTGKEWVLDTKCLSIVRNDDILDTFALDFQQNYYLWCWREETKRYPAGAVKNIFRRPLQRRGVKEEFADYIERIRKEYADPKQWDQRGKDTVGYFVRYELRVTPNEIDRWKATRLDPIMREIRAWVEGKAEHYPSDRCLVDKYGRSRLFDGLVFGDFSNYYKRTKPFPELKAA